MKKLIFILALIVSCGVHKNPPPPSSGVWLDVPPSVKIDTLSYTRLNYPPSIRIDVNRTKVKIKQ